MKNIRKILALVLALLMLSALSVSAFASGETTGPTDDESAETSTDITEQQAKLNALQARIDALSVTADSGLEELTAAKSEIDAIKADELYSEVAEASKEKLTAAESSVNSLLPEKINAAIDALSDAADLEALNAELTLISDAMEAMGIDESGLTGERAAKLIAAGERVSGEVQTLDETSSAVAKIGDVEYESFADAVEAAKNATGDVTIILLQDCSSELKSAWGIEKKVTITGNYTVTFTDYSIGITGSSGLLTLDGCKVIINNAAHVAYSDNPANAAIMLDKGGSITLDNGASLVIDSPAGDGIATWDTASSMREYIRILNGSSYECKNAANGGGIEDYNNSTGITVYVIVSGGSTVYFHDNYSGFIASLNVTVDNSTVTVSNNSGNGSNGPYYTFTNNANVTFNNNGSWGISAWRIDMSDGATLTAKNNGYSGIWTRVINVDGKCTVDVEENGSKAFSSATAPGMFFQGNGTYTSTIEAGANVTIKNNAGAGIYTKQSVCNLTINGNTEITGNGKGYTVEGKYGADNGGGVYNIGTMVLGSAVTIYNNHAEKAGDDIYSTGTITFGEVGSEWYLDGNTDGIGCSGTIDGWYYDGYKDSAEANRWEAHDEDNLFAEEYIVTTSSVSGTLALKAAHGLCSITVSKVWEHNGNTNAPKSVTVNLVRTENGEDKVAQTVTLNDGNKWTYTFENLPTDESYKVTEEDVEGYDTDYATETSGNEIRYTITNTFKVGELTVSKTVEGEGADKNQEFSFTVTLTDADGNAISGTYGGLSFEDGKATFELKDGESRIIDKLPAGTKYAVTEAAVASYRTEATGESGTIEADKTAEAEFTNTYVTINVIVNKVWSDNSNKEGERPGYVTMQLYVDGKAFGDAVTLDASNGWSYTWSGIGADSEYTVKEVNVPKGYYALTKQRGNTITITNCYGVKTGDESNLALWLVLAGVSLAGVAAAVIYTRKKRGSAEK